jgi:phage terminase small subunit
MPGPPPEHPHLRLLKGNSSKRPARMPPEPARAEGCPPPPKHLNGYAREVWLELAPELHRLNLLTVLDVGPFSADAAPMRIGNRPKRRCSARAS